MFWEKTLNVSGEDIYFALSLQGMVWPHLCGVLLERQNEKGGPSLTSALGPCQLHF